MKGIRPMKRKTKKSQSFEIGGRKLMVEFTSRESGSIAIKRNSWIISSQDREFSFQLALNRLSFVFKLEVKANALYVKTFNDLTLTYICIYPKCLPMQVLVVSNDAYPNAFNVSCRCCYYFSSSDISYIS